MRPILILFFSLTLLINCKIKNEAQENIPAPPTNVQGPGHSLKASCFFKLDDKYSTVRDSAQIEEWLTEKSKVLLNTDSIPNIFHRNGGGPNGAQWNPGTDLYLAVLAKGSSMDKETPSIYINGSLYDQKSNQKEIGLFWYAIPLDYWEKQLTNIDSEAIGNLYSPELLAGAENGIIDLSAPLDEGQILKFEIHYKKETITRYFHIAFGE